MKAQGILKSVGQNLTGEDSSRGVVRGGQKGRLEPWLPGQRI